MHPQWLTNTYLVAGADGGAAFLVDAGGPLEPLFEQIERRNLDLTHVLLTHHHFDHVAELDRAREKFPDVQILIHELERSEVPQATGDLVPGSELEIGGLRVQPLHTPGHSAGMVSLLVDGSDVFTGDTLFAGSVGGVRAPGHTTFADIKSSIMDVLLALPDQTVVRPGHSDPTTIGNERETNKFIRIWDGRDSEGNEPCLALGDEAQLVLLGSDYDGGYKAWVRWPDGRDDIVPGSTVERT